MTVRVWMQGALLLLLLATGAAAQKTAKRTASADSTHHPITNDVLCRRLRCDLPKHPECIE
jgi:hypothetical protein